MWAETNQALFFPEHEEVAVADHFVATFATAYQQVLGKGQRQAKFTVLPSNFCFQQVGGTDDQARQSIPPRH